MEEKKEIFISQKFDSVDLMASSSINWQYEAIYKLMPNAFHGENNVIMLPTLQLSYATRSGGILYNICSPKGTVSVGVVLRSDGKFCFGNTKLKKGDIVFFDDKIPNSMVTSDIFKAAVISIPRRPHRKFAKQLGEYTGKVIEDTDSILTAKLTKILEQFKNDPSIHENHSAQEAIEEDLFVALENLIEHQTPYLPKLTKGEKIALKIRDRIYKRITKKVTISSLAEEFGVSEQTLQNAFKSLFGMTPNKFLRNLKLNHVRKVLIHASPNEMTIVRAANRWGFTHMGHFSRYYTDLFGENPSVTLNREPEADTCDK